jgi:hypothetical protein
MRVVVAGEIVENAQRDTIFPLQLLSNKLCEICPNRFLNNILYLLSTTIQSLRQYKEKESERKKNRKRANVRERTKRRGIQSYHL